MLGRRGKADPDRHPVRAPPEAAETLAASEQTRVVAKRTFIHADPSDPIHYGSGKVTVYENTVFLVKDFEVGPGPKYHVYLVPKAMVRESAHVAQTMFVDLGRLRSFKGNQKYTIPAGIDLTKFDSVVIDPPSLRRKQKDLNHAMGVYTKLNRNALKLVREGGLLVTASCSTRISNEDFFQILRRAASGARVNDRMIAFNQHAPDHPGDPAFPEGRYLKCIFAVFFLGFDIFFFC